MINVSETIQLGQGEGITLTDLPDEVLLEITCQETRGVDNVYEKKTLSLDWKQTLELQAKLNKLIEVHRITGLQFCSNS